jgi:hypothetical protein
MLECGQAFAVVDDKFYAHSDAGTKLLQKQRWGKLPGFRE